MWSAIIVTKWGTYKGTISYGKGRAKIITVSREIRIMMIMTVLLLLLVMI
jgi:hypothetical protein